MIVPRVPNPFDDDAQRTARLESHISTGSRRRRWLLIGGAAVLLVWVVLALAGLPGSGLVLVPIGIFTMLGGVLDL